MTVCPHAYSNVAWSRLLLASGFLDIVHLFPVFVVDTSLWLSVWVKVYVR